MFWSGDTAGLHRMTASPYSGDNVVKIGPIHCVLFDLDGTLYDSAEYNRYFDSEMVNIVSTFLKIEHGEASRVLAARRKEKGTLTGAMESLGITRENFHALVAERINPGLHLSPDERTRAVLTQLRDRGLKIGLVTNSGRKLVMKILDALGLEVENFDVVITGTEVKPKPSHEPYLLALERLGCSIDDALYVGDREEAEIRPAHEIGLKTVLISRVIDQKDSEGADAVVHDMTELEDLIT